MRIQKFQAADMREALIQVKRTLGSDAVIVSTRDVRRGLLGKGVEVTAATDAFEDGDAPPAPAAAGNAAPPPAAAVSTMNEADVERILLPLRSELRSLQSLLKPVLASQGGGLRGEIEALRRQISELADLDRAAGPRLEDAARSPSLVAPSKARVVALVGPTGVGKTTTIAKLAARAALAEQRETAIITLDDYRVGGEEQIRTFAQLIDVPLHAVSGREGLQKTLRSLDGIERIFIDTAGRSPRDSEAIISLKNVLLAAEAEVHLALPASASLRTIESVHNRFRPLAPARLLFTKLDEADALATIIQAPAKLGLPVTWLTTGQRVPEDLEEASAARLLDLARHGLAAQEVGA